MAKFVSKQLTPSFQVSPETSVLVRGPQGDQVVKTASKYIKFSGGQYETKDEAEIERLRRDSRFGTEHLREITEEDIEIMKIKEEKLKEAEEVIKEIRKKKVKK